jgi:hypothetical protein
MRNINPNTGANMAYGIQSAVARNKAYADAYAQKNNIEAGYAFQNANIANAVNQYNTAARHTAADEYARNKGAADTANAQNRVAMNKAAAQYAKDKKQSSYDKTMLEYMKPFFDYGSSTSDVNALMEGYGMKQTVSKKSTSNTEVSTTKAKKTANTKAIAVKNIKAKPKQTTKRQSDDGVL